MVSSVLVAACDGSANGTRCRLRVHPTQEWHDLYQRETNDELQSFLDRYLKGMNNDWEETPKVRVSMLKFDKVCWYIPAFMFLDRKSVV